MYKQPLRGSGGVEGRKEGRKEGMRPLARFVVRSPRPQATDSRRDVDCYRLKENERSERAPRQRRTAHVGFLARLEEADDGRGRRDGRWTRAWTDKLSPPYVVIDSARGQDAITPNSALKRPGRREGGEREEGGESEVGRKRASGRTNEHITQILAGGYRSFCILGGEGPACSHRARKPNF